MSSVFNRIEKVNNLLNKIGIFIAGVSVILMMGLIVADVFSRNVLNTSIPGTYEIVQNYFMPLSIFPCLAFAYRSGVLPRIGEVIEKTPGGFQKVVGYMIFAIEMVIFTLATYYGWIFAMTGVSDQASFPAGGNLIPLYPIMFVIPFGFALVLLEVILSSFKPFIMKNANENIINDDSFTTIK
jgi:TRAP-type C4-dicarboxylate transport system permease small subunit